MLIAFVFSQYFVRNGLIRFLGNHYEIYIFLFQLIYQQERTIKFILFIYLFSPLIKPYATRTKVVN